MMDITRYIHNPFHFIFFGSLVLFHVFLSVKVVCSECYHMSVTFEPFMYLSVPIPHALEKQLGKTTTQ